MIQYGLSRQNAASPSLSLPLPSSSSVCLSISPSHPLSLSVKPHTFALSLFSLRTSHTNTTALRGSKRILLYSQIKSGFQAVAESQIIVNKNTHIHTHTKSYLLILFNCFYFAVFFFNPLGCKSYLIYLHILLLK